ncbi:MAG: Uma2 family endonuclease [Hyphomicrobiales bacterium]
MNVHLTQAAEGLPRRAFTTSDVERMVEAGLIGPDERIELIGGELVPMSPKGIRHEQVKQWLNRQLITTLPDWCEVIPETTFRLSEDTYVEPDFLVYKRADGLDGLKGDMALLSIEVAVSSLAYDKGRKAQVMAAFGVPELWVVDAERMVTTLHRDPTPTGYRTVYDVERRSELRPHLIAGFSLVFDTV